MPDVTFLWPWAWATLLVWVGFGGFWLRQRSHQWRAAMAWSPVATLAAINTQPPRWTRMGRALLWGGLILLLTAAAARPVVTAWVPTRSAQLMLVLDISLSMLAADLPPNRLMAATKTARQFINRLPDEIRVGLTVFAGDAIVLSPPTKDHRQVDALLGALQPSDLHPRTEIGTALRATLQSLRLTQPDPTAKQPPEAVIVLLSDGDSREGFPWEQAAQMAREQRVRVHTVGIGLDAPTTIQYQGITLPVFFGETTLREIARLAGGNYHRVQQETDFQTLYDAVSRRSLHLEKQTSEWSGALACLALLWLLGVLIEESRNFFRQPVSE